MRKIIVFILILALCCTACTNNSGIDDGTTAPSATIDQSTNNATVPVENDGQDPTVGDPTSPTAPTNPTEETMTPIITKYEIATGAANIWDKEKQALSLDTIRLDANWMNYITIGDATILSNTMADISLVPNYYYGDNDSWSDLETVYFVPTLMLSNKTNKIQFGKYASVYLDIVTTTFEYDLQRYAIIDEIRFIATANPYEGGFDEMIAASEYVDGLFGIGSKYSAVTNIIGDTEDIVTEQFGDGVRGATCIYVAEDVELILTFMWFDADGIDSAILTSINWIPTSVRTVLHSQDIQSFENYNNIFSDHVDDGHDFVEDEVSPPDVNNSATTDNTNPSNNAVDDTQ